MSVSLARRILAERLLPPEVLHRALLESLRSATPLLEILIGARRDLAPMLSDMLAGRHGQAPASWQPDRSLVAQLPPGMCERLLAFPIRAGADGEVEVAAADPTDPHIVREFVAHLGRTVIMVASPLSQIFQVAGVRIVPPLPEYVSVSDRPIPLVRRSTSKPRVEAPPSSAADYEPISPMPSRPVTAPPPAEPVQAPRPSPSATMVSRPTPSAAELSSATTLAQPGRGLSKDAASKDAPSKEKAEKASAPSPVQRTAAAQTRVSVVPRSPDAAQTTTTRVPTSRGLQSPLAAGSSVPPSSAAPLSEAPRPQVSTAPKAPVVATKPATPTTSKTSVTPAPAPVAAAPAATKSEPVATKVEPVAAKPATLGKPTGMTPAPGAVRSVPPEAPRPILVARADGAVPDAAPVRAPAAQFRPAVPLGSKAPAPTERRPVAPQISKAPERPEVVQPAVQQVSKAPAPAPAGGVSRPSAAQVSKAPAPAPAGEVSRPSAAQVSKAPAPAVSRPVVPRLSLADVEQRLRAAESPDDVARALGTGGGSGAIVFSVKPDQFVVRAVGGQDDRPELSVLREGPSALRVAAEQDEYLGPLFDAPAHEKLTTWLEAGVPVFVASVKVRDKVALVFMLSAKTDEDGTRAFGRKMAELAARALEDLIVRRKRTSHP